MFLFGSTGSLLPYIITLAAMWSGILLGYGKVFNFKSQSLPANEISINLQSDRSENIEICNIFDDFAQQNADKDDVAIANNYQPELSLWLCQLFKYGHLSQIFPAQHALTAFLNRGPPSVC